MHQQVSSTSNFYNQNNINNSQRSSSSCFPPQNGSTYANDWTGVPLIKSNSSSSTISSEPQAQQRYHHKKNIIYSTRSNGFEFDENSMSRLAKHTQGAPIIMSNSNRYRSNKPIKTMQSSFNHENCGSRNFSSSSTNNHSNTNNNNNTNYVTVTKQQPITSSSTSTTVATPESCSIIESENQNYEDAGYNSNGTCLPRIIKPRKRRKKDRKPLVSSVDINPPTQHLQTSKNSYPFTFAANQSSNGYLQSMTSSNNSNNNNNNNIGVSNAFNAVNGGENYTRPMPLNDMNLFFNNDFELNSANPASTSSPASSPISLSNSSLSSSSATTSSCSCRLCDPNCRIWAFPLRRSFSDNSATELDRHNDGLHFESMPLNGSSKKDVGVIGGNRVKTEQSHSNHHHHHDSSYTLFDMIEYENYQNKQQSQQHTLLMDRLRSESLSDSGDSGCDLLLGNLNISDEILSSTLETMSDGLTDEGLTRITQKLSEFNILPSPNSCSENSSSDGSAATNSNRLFIGENNIHFNTQPTECVDLDQRQFRVNNNNLTTFNTNINTESSSSRYSSCDFIGNNLQSLLALDSVSSSRMTSVGNQNLMSPTLVNRQNSNNLDFNNNNNHNPAPVCNSNSIEGLKERTLFDCFNNMTWTRP